MKRRLLGALLLVGGVAACAEQPMEPGRATLDDQSLSLYSYGDLPIGGCTVTEGSVGPSYSMGVGLMSSGSSTTGEPLDDLGSGSTIRGEGYGINDFGTVVGYHRPVAGGPFLAAQATGNTFQTLGAGTLVPSHDFAIAYDINNAGVAVGVSGNLRIPGSPSDPTQGTRDVELLFNLNNAQAFVFQGGTMTALNPSGFSTSAAYAINERGQVVGFGVRTGSTTVRSFLYDLNTGATTLLPGAGAQAYGLNDAAPVQVVGRTGNQGFVWTAGSTALTTFSVPGGIGSTTATTARDINDQGDIVGWTYNNTAAGVVYRGYVRSALGVVTIIPPFSTTRAPSFANNSSLAFAINNQGEVTGHAQGGISLPAGFTAFRWRDGVLVDLGKLPGSCGGIGLGINECGAVAGAYSAFGPWEFWGARWPRACPTPPAPNLEIVKTAGAATVDAGSPISFTVQVSVTGSGTANAVTLTDALPTGTGISWSIQGSVPECSITGGVLTCDFGNLTAPATRSVTVTSPSTPQSCGEYLNIASVQAANHGTVASNQASVTVGNCPTVGEVCPVTGPIGGIDVGTITDYLFVFTDGRSDANWQSSSKGYVGNVAVNGLRASRRSSGSFAYAGTIFTNDHTMGGWQRILNNNPAQSAASFGQTTRLAQLEADLKAAMLEINALPVTPGFESRASTSLAGDYSARPETRFVINVTSGFGISSKIEIRGRADQIFILRWDTDANFANGYQGQVKFQSGGAIVPMGGLTAANFVHVAGDLNASGGGSNPAAPFPQGPRLNNGYGALIPGASNFSGGGFFTGYWLTTGRPTTRDPATGLWFGETSSFSNAIFVGGWYSMTTKFSMTSGTSAVHVCPFTQPPSGGVTPPPTDYCQLGKPSSITFEYTGAHCSTSSNAQGSKATCSQTGGDLEGPATITVTTSGVTASQTTVEEGDTFELSSSKFPSDTRITIRTANGATQSLSIHTSCSKPIVHGDTFGSLTLVGYRPL
jgi:uncharacterized repeat protein (TIGR01451 family)